MKLIKLENVDYNQPQVNACCIKPEYGEILSSHNFYIVGDLHGNYLKLIGALIHLKFLSYKNDCTVDSNHKRFTVVLENLILKIHNKINVSLGKNIINGIFNLIDDTFNLNPHQIGKKICFIGDTHCDRGKSDFITFCIFFWMMRSKINFSVILGNHEMAVLLGGGFLDNPDPKKFKYNSSISEGYYHQFSRSFDFFYLKPDLQKEFLKMYKEFWERMLFLNIVFEKNSELPLLLTHAPASWNYLEKILKVYASHIPDTTPDKLDDIVIKILKLLFVNKSNNPVLNGLNQFICQGLLTLLQSRPLNSFPIKTKNFIENLTEFCHSRAMDIPFFVENAGINIFGHMSGTFEGVAILPRTQVCIDTRTGMPNCRLGPVVYACLNI